MDQQNDRRQEKRLGYRWPVRFSEDFAESMSQGLMVDISSAGIAFDCPPDGMRPAENQHLTVRFSIPRFEGDDPTATVSITRIGNVCRIQEGESGTCRVAIQFDTPLALRPAEVTTLNSMCGGSLES
jgi:PilZ domain-containing protein